MVQWEHSGSNSRELVYYRDLNSVDSYVVPVVCQTHVLSLTSYKSWLYVWFRSVGNWDLKRRAMNLRSSRPWLVISLAWFGNTDSVHFLRFSKSSRHSLPPGFSTHNGFFIQSNLRNLINRHGTKLGNFCLHAPRWPLIITRSSFMDTQQKLQW